MERRTGESIVGQQKEDYIDPAWEKPGTLADEGAFVSPEDLEGMLSALDQQDGRFLERGGSLQSEEEGDFLSPEDVSESQAQEAMIEEIPCEPPSVKKENQEKTRREFEDPALLSRIASELRSIKTELSDLKNSYDEAVTQTASAPGLSQASGPGEAKTTQEAKASAMPETLFQDMKKLLGYLDRLLESLPEEKIDQFARSEYFELYRKVFEYFDLV